MNTDNSGVEAGGGLEGVTGRKGASAILSTIVFKCALGHLQEERQHIFVIYFVAKHQEEGELYAACKAGDGVCPGQPAS